MLALVFAPAFAFQGETESAYDFPDLVRSLGEEKAIVTAPVDGAGRLLK